MDTYTIKQQILFRQHLTDRTDRLRVARDLLGLQAQFLPNARHALAIRTNAPLPGDWGEGLVKSWGIRGTMHVFAEDDLPLFLYRGKSKVHTGGEISPAREALFADAILRFLDEGVGTRAALRTRCEALGMTKVEAGRIFHGWGGTIRTLAEAGKLCYLVREEKTFRRCPDFSPMEAEAAKREMLLRYFTHYGPASLRDAAYFFGKSQMEIRNFLDELPVNSLNFGGMDRFYIGSLAACPDIPSCLFLAGFDQLLLGYQKSESLFLPPEHLRGIFNLAGIVFPAVLFKGRVVGRWKWEREKKKFLFMPFESLKTSQLRLVEKAAQRLYPDIGEYQIGL